MNAIFKIMIFPLVMVMLNQCITTDNNEITPVVIPDNNFRNVLIESGFDQNGDGFFDYDEAAMVISLNVSYDSIADMTGIEAFVNLDTLNCSGNQLASLDVSKSLALKTLYCQGNALTSLDLSQNTVLELLHCGDNQLTSLKVSNYPILRWLYCNNNQLTSLVLTHSSALIGLYLNNMPSLHKVCVWKMPFPPAGVQVDTSNSPNLYFTMDCN